jgi:hypothetical protein
MEQSSMTFHGHNMGHDGINIFPHFFFFSHHFSKSSYKSIAFDATVMVAFVAPVFLRGFTECVYVFTTRYSTPQQPLGSNKQQACSLCQYSDSS